MELVEVSRTAVRVEFCLIPAPSKGPIDYPHYFVDLHSMEHFFGGPDVLG